MDLNIFYYENYNSDAIAFDKNNPRYVLSKPYVNDIIGEIAKAKPYSLSINEVKKRILKADENIIEDLINIDVLHCENSMLKINCPIFLNDDKDMLLEMSLEIARQLGAKIINHKDEIYEKVRQINNGFNEKINLYNLFCGNILDGLFFDYLEDENIVANGKKHKSGLDYIVIIYENAKSLNELSNSLLCSYNRFGNDMGTFQSFGDSMGDRLDFYRFFRLRNLEKLPQNFSSINKAYENLLIDEKDEILLKDKIIEKYIDFINGKEITEKYYELFEKTGYLLNGKITVPIYKLNEVKPIVNELFEIMKAIVGDDLKKSLSIIKNYNGLTCNIHNIDVKETANELYHLIFGQVNEYLVKQDFVINPTLKENEGRYEKSFQY